MSTGTALAMRLKLRTLMQKHRVQSNPVKIPLFEPAEHPMILEGYASTDDVDGDRCKFRPYAFGYPLLFRHGYPKLHLKHDTSREVGKIDTLQYDELGNLQCWCTVTDRVANRYPAFSIAATVNQYSIVNADTPDFYGLITSATISEISLTDRPSNPYALVMDRNRVSPAVQTLELLTEKMKCLQKITVLLKERNHATL